MTDESSGQPSREQLLTTTLSRTGEAVVVAAIGEIDILTVDRFRSALHQGLERAGEGPLVVDLTRVTFLGSAGLATLVKLASLTHREHLPLRVVVDHTRPVVRPIQLSGLDDVLALYQSVEQALSR